MKDAGSSFKTDTASGGGRAYCFIRNFFLLALLHDLDLHRTPCPDEVVDSTTELLTGVHAAVEPAIEAG